MLDLVHLGSLCRDTLSNFGAFSFQDCEKGRISPSLANTGNKTSDVIEPPDCPVKFDNPEDVFA